MSNTSVSYTINRNNLDKVNGNGMRSIIEKAVKHFKEYYARFDKRILRMKKAVDVTVGNELIYVSTRFYNKHYGQIYRYGKDGDKYNINTYGMNEKDLTI